VTGRHVVARVGEFPPGTRRIVEVDDLSIGVFNVRGSYHALRNRCPHQGAPLCLGRLKARVTASRAYELVYGPDDELVKCPWHGWEFEVASGRSVFNPHRVRVPAYPVTIEEPEPEDPSVPTYPVTIEDGLVVLHV